MNSIICVRHGQSQANAGAPTNDPLSIELTQIGAMQAAAVATQWNITPGLILRSPAVRAISTALPTQLRFTSVPAETWPIHEFTYLDPARCAGTTAAQRREWVESYWSRAHPIWRDGPEAESFSDFMGRVDEAIRRLSLRSTQTTGAILLFGHGQFINAMRWRLTGAQQPWDMKDYREFDMAWPVDHCHPIQLPLSSP